MYTTVEAQVIPKTYYCNSCDFHTTLKEEIDLHVNTKHLYTTRRIDNVTFTYCPTEEVFTEAYCGSSCYRGMWSEAGWYAAFNNTMLHVDEHRKGAVDTIQANQAFLHTLKQFEKERTCP